MIKDFIKLNLGFTLIETLVAISILSISILGTFTAVQGGLQSSIAAKNQIAAFYLAQEAMEYIKNIRDENALNSLGATQVNWLHGLSELAGDACYFGKTCTIDSPQKTTATCSGGFGTCPVLRQDVTTGLLGYNGAWQTTNFIREIQFQSLAPDESLVTISVSWVNNGITRSFQIQQLLFNRE